MFCFTKYAHGCHGSHRQDIEFEGKKIQTNCVPTVLHASLANARTNEFTAEAKQQYYCPLTRSVII